MTSLRIRKIDGQVEEFSQKKLRRSLLNSGASEADTEAIIRDIIEEGIPKSTRDLHRDVYNRLLRTSPHIAARYSLKKSLHTLGPTGYPFEKYIASIFQYLGYQSTTNVIIQGSCVEHEMDVVSRNDEELLYIECKYHQNQSAKSNVKVPLYVKARTDDLHEFQSNVEPEGIHFKYYIATNTRFTTDAVEYAKCKGLHLLSWEQPEGNSLPKIIDKHGLHPVTVLTCLTKKQAIRLINLEVVMVRDIPLNEDKFASAGITPDLREKVLGEAEAIMSLNESDR